MPIDNDGLNRSATCAIVFAVALAIAGCYTNPELPCEDDTNCVFLAFEGRCLQSDDGRRFCADPHRTCPSGWAWDDYAATAIRGLCIDAAKIPKDGGMDGAMDAAPVDATMSRDGG